MLLLSLAVALCFSLPGCLPSVLHQASGLLLLPGPRAPWFHSPLMLAHGSNLTVCSQGPWPLSHRIHWSFSRAGQDPHRQTPQGALDRSRSFLACQDFGIPAVFILRQVLTVRIPRTPLVLKSPTEFPCSRLGSPARSSPVHSCGTLSSPTRSSRRPGQGIFRECFMGPVQPGFQARRVPALPVMITSGPEDQESGQSSESGQWSPGQDSLLINRQVHLSNSSPLLHSVVRVSRSPEQMMFFPRERRR